MQLYDLGKLLSSEHVFYSRSMRKI